MKLRTLAMFLFSFVSLILVSSARADFPYGTANTSTGALNDQAPKNVTTYSFAEDDKVVVRMTRISGDYHPSIKVSQSGGVGGGGSSTGIGPVSDLLETPMLLIGGKTYDVTASGSKAGSWSGSYRLFFQSLSHPVGAVALSYGQIAAGALDEAGQIDTYTFSATAGDRVRFTASRVSGTIDPRPLIFTSAPNSNAVLGASVHSTGGSAGSPTDNPTISREYILPGTGSYVVTLDDVDDYGTTALDNIETGQYTLLLECVSGSCLSVTPTPLPTLVPTPTPTPTTPTPTPTPAVDIVSFLSSQLLTMIESAKLQLNQAKAILPGKPKASLSKKQKLKINAKRIVISNARLALRQLVVQIVALEKVSGEDLRTVHASFTSANLQKLDKLLRVAVASRSTPSQVKSSWKRFGLLLGLIASRAI